MKFLVLLVYYNRPSMVTNALNSLKNQSYKNFTVACIDDGSDIKLEDIVKEQYPELVDQCVFYYIPDTIEQKELQGGSRHGSFMYKAIHEIGSDYTIFLCDDDALLPTYLEELNTWYEARPELPRSYCHITGFDPLTESIETVPIRGHSFNYTHDLYCSCVTDATQVSFKTSLFKEHGFVFPIGTRNMDCSLYSQMDGVYGLCPFNGIMGQYKGTFTDQLSYRPNTYQVIDKAG